MLFSITQQIVTGLASQLFFLTDLLFYTCHAPLPSELDYHYVYFYPPQPAYLIPPEAQAYLQHCLHGHETIAQRYAQALGFRDFYAQFPTDAEICIREMFRQQTPQLLYEEIWR